MFWEVKIANFFEEEDIAGFSPTSGFPNAPNIFFHGDFAILTSQNISETSSWLQDLIQIIDLA